MAAGVVLGLSWGCGCIEDCYATQDAASGTGGTGAPPPPPPPPPPPSALQGHAAVLAACSTGGSTGRCNKQYIGSATRRESGCHCRGWGVCGRTSSQCCSCDEERGGTYMVERSRMTDSGRTALQLPWYKSSHAKPQHDKGKRSVLRQRH